MLRLARRLVLVVAAIAASAGIASADKIDDLARALLTDSSYKVRTQAAVILGKLGDPRGVVPLIEALHDDNETVRAVAAASLGRLGDRRAQGPLESLRSDASGFVRQSADRALASLVPSPSSGGPATGGGVPMGARFFVNVNVAGKGSADAQRALREALTSSMAKLPKVTTNLAGSAAAQAVAARKLTGWSVEGNITNLRVAGGQLDCDVSVAIATWPSRAIKATTSAGASIPGVRSSQDPAAQRDCLEGAAQQIAEDVGKFLATVR